MESQRSAQRQTGASFTNSLPMVSFAPGGHRKSGPLCLPSDFCGRFCFPGLLPAQLFFSTPSEAGSPQREASGQWRGVSSSRLLASSAGGSTLSDGREGAGLFCHRTLGSHPCRLEKLAPPPGAADPRLCCCLGTAPQPHPLYLETPGVATEREMRPQRKERGDVRGDQLGGWVQAG